MGGVSPFPVNFFPQAAVRGGGGGYIPFLFRKNLLKICPKTVFSAKNATFGEQISDFFQLRGGGTPFSVKKFP